MTTLTIADSGPWTLGVLIGAPIVALVVLVLLVGGVWLISIDKRVSEYDRGVPKVVGIFAVAVGLALAVLMITPVGFYPFDAEYHQWRETSGTVAKIDKRLIGSGDSMEDKFVVRFTSDGQQFGCDDTRCAGVSVGDKLTLSCKRAWQYTGTDGYDCRFVATEVSR